MYLYAILVNVLVAVARADPIDLTEYVLTNVCCFLPNMQIIS
jgi:hypothetical protein